MTLWRVLWGCKFLSCQKFENHLEILLLYFMYNSYISSFSVCRNHSTWLNLTTSKPAKLLKPNLSPKKALTSFSHSHTHIHTYSISFDMNPNDNNGWRDYTSTKNVEKNDARYRYCHKWWLVRKGTCRVCTLWMFFVCAFHSGDFFHILQSSSFFGEEVCRFFYSLSEGFRRKIKSCEVSNLCCIVSGYSSLLLDIW